MNYPTIAAESLVLPIFVADRRGDGFSVSGEVIGSGFLLSWSHLLTAGHVITTIRESGKQGLIGLPDPEKNSVVVVQILDMEELPHDIGLARLPTRPAAAALPVLSFTWSQTPPAALAEVWTLGYAYGMHVVRGQRRTIQRSFRGHIVSSPDEFEVPSRVDQPFAAYELSFQAPRGLSGSPLLIGTEPSLDKVAVIGVVIGNSSTQMLVHESEERETNGATTTVFQRFESLTLGIAVQSSTILGLRSDLLGSSVGEYLSSQNRLGSQSADGAPAA